MAHRGIEQEEGLRQHIGMLLNHSQRLRLEEILLICIASASVNGARGAVVVEYSTLCELFEA